MKKYLPFILLIVFFSCHSSKKSEQIADTVKKISLLDSVRKYKTFDSDKKKALLKSLITSNKPYKLNDDYTVIDTGKYTNGPMEGIYAVVKRNGVIADTIDRSVGIQTIAQDQYLYYTLNNSNDYDNVGPRFLNLNMGKYYLVLKNKKIPFSKLGANFDDYFSSPQVIGNKVYYWQIKTTEKTGESKISAAEYDPSTKKLVTHYILTDILETDDSGYLPTPYLRNDTIFFEQADATRKFSKDFKPYN